MHFFIVAVVDVSYGERYKEYGAEWTPSMLCKGVAYIGYATFILSTACFTLIMQQRYLGITYPLHKREISVASADDYKLANLIPASASFCFTLILETKLTQFTLATIRTFFFSFFLGGRGESHWFYH